MKKIIAAALILRLILSFWGEHSDIVNFYWWAMDIYNNGFNGFYDRTIANAMRATYPPISNYILWLVALMHGFFWKIFWFLNIKISIFPSNLMYWWESKYGWYFLNKLPIVLADTGVVWVIYKIVEILKNKKSALIASSLFAFLPTFWYGSAIWGQTESLFMLPVLLAFYFLINKKNYTSIFFYVVSVFIKPTVFVIFPIYILWWLKKRRIKEIVISVAASSAFAYLLYYPFHPTNTILWAANFYRTGLGGELNYIQANSFNFWSLIFGFENIQDKMKFLSIPLDLWGYILYLISITPITIKLLRYKNIDSKAWLLVTVLVAFAAYMFLPRMHERYLYPAILFLIPVVVLFKELKTFFWSVTTIYLINLYHFWWYPEIPTLVNILSNSIVERTIIMINVFLFFYLYSFTLRKDLSLKNIRNK